MAVTVREAFSGFCEEEMGLSAEKLLQATFRPALEDGAWFGELGERLELEADRTTIEECREAFGAHWQRIVEWGIGEPHGKQPHRVRRL
jgi:hypothetical protein